MEDKLDKVALVAGFKEQQSAGNLKARRQALENEQARLMQLEQFKQEYESRLDCYADKSIPARQLQDYRLFLTKLNQAIEQQHQLVTEAGQAADRAREQWVDQSVHKSAVDQLVDHRRQQERTALGKKEQRDSDERALLNYGDPS
ncbi:MAG: flagellar export protein FliJ [Porticoccaceae bacterium]